MKKKIVKIIFNLLLLIGLLGLVSWNYIAQPTFDANQSSSLMVNEGRLKQHVEKLSIDFYPRNHTEINNLNLTADYIEENFLEAGAKVEIQSFMVNGHSYKNVIANFPRQTSLQTNQQNRKRIIIGAHYDAHQQTRGADDNASGVAGLLELAYLLGQQSLERDIQLVAYSLEEPPHFNTYNMGSYFHANSIEPFKTQIHAVIVLEMIGYFSDEAFSQDYPSPLLRLFYPNTGNFITVVGNLQQRDFTQTFKVGMKGVTTLPVFSFNGPQSMPGIGSSDHRSYWPLDLNAIMITDTAYYRNKQYHHLGDSAERLNYEKMGQVVVCVFEALKSL